MGVFQKELREKGLPYLLKDTVLEKVVHPS